MAWYKRYYIPFESINHTQYIVFISTQTDGSLTRLTGAAEPFVTEENHEDDIFSTPIRGQSGYISIIDETPDGTLLQTLIPNNNLEKFVELYTVTWNSDFTSYTLNNVIWRGFLRAQAFTQPWHHNKKILQFPVISLLSALQFISLDESLLSANMRYASLFVYPFQILGISPDYFHLRYNIRHSIGITPYVSHFWDYKLNSEAFFEQEDSNEEGQSSFSWIGMSYYDAISSLLRLYGLMMREKGKEIYIMMYDHPDTAIDDLKYSWAEVVTISAIGPSSHYIPSLTIPVDQDLLSTVDFRSKNNTEEFVQGARRASVLLPIKDYKANLSLPLTTEDNSQVIQVTVDNPVVAVQPHLPRTNDIEVFTYNEYLLDGQDPINTSNYQACLNNSVLYSNTSWISQHVITGSFPIRWYSTNNGENVPMLKNGLLLNQRFRRTNTAVDNLYCYQLHTSINYHLSNGYLRIRFRNFNFDQGYTGSTSHPEAPTTPHFGPWTGLVPSPTAMRTDIYVVIRFGNKYWNELTGQWETFQANGANATDIPFDNEGSIISNYTEGMPVSDKDGYFIPIPSSLSGKIYFYIADIADCREGNTFRYVHSRIISDLIIDYLPNTDITVSHRTQNAYRKTILASGFQSDKVITLNVGTNNNNIPSPVFLLDSSGKKFESIPYWTADLQQKKERPESNLLDRIVAQNNVARRNYTAVISDSVNLIDPFSYNGKRFFGVESKHNWRNNTIDVKLIEIS